MKDQERTRGFIIYLLLSMVFDSINANRMIERG